MLGDLRLVQVEYAQDWLAEPLEGNKQADWRTDPAKSGAGGATGDIGTHAFNLANFVSGLTLETLAAVVLLRQGLPELKIRVVNVVDLMTLPRRKDHPHGMDETLFKELFTDHVDVVFAFHGYPGQVLEAALERGDIALALHDDVERVAHQFGGALRHFVLAGRDLHDDDDGREVTVITDDERPFVIYGTPKPGASDARDPG